jgi:hypothetical protein
MPQVSPSRSPQERDGGPGAPARLPVRPIPLLTLWRMCQTDDEHLAHEIKRKAIAEGAAALDVARAWRARDERIAAEVIVIYGGW